MFLLYHLGLMFSSHLAAGRVDLKISTRVSTLTLGLPPLRSRTSNVLNISLTTPIVKVVEKKEMPTWISESTVRTAEDQVTRLYWIHKCDL